MRLHATLGSRLIRRGLAAIALVAMSAGAASAQLVFDGNLLWDNNNTGTLAGQFTGAAGGGAPSCPGGFTTATLGTVSYTNNFYLDPLLPDAPYKTNTVPNFQPTAGSPAFGTAVVVPNDGFFEQNCWMGAIGPNVGDDWTAGWTTYDSTGAGRPVRPVATYDNVFIRGHAYWAPDSNYLVRGQLRVVYGASLTIAPGVYVLEENATVGTIRVDRGGRLIAVGTSCDPIVVTSDENPGSQERGQCGGIVINGYAKTNVVNSCAGDSAASEGGDAGYFGGNDDNHNAGVLRYVRVEFAGREITPNNELNAFTWNACGKETHADFLQAFRGADDGFEFFGGSMDVTHLFALDGTDDGFDWQLGTRNRAQYVLVRTSPEFAPSGTQNGDKGIEADNNGVTDPNEVQCSGRSNTIVVNATFVGDKRSGPNYPGATTGVNWRLGTGGQLLNSIIMNYKSRALRVDNDETFEAHCAAPPADPPLFCNTLAVRPITGGEVFVSNSAPNPFRGQVTFSFTLPESGPVEVAIFSPDGRLVQTVADGVMPAGNNILTWKVDRNVPSGVYFYRVFAGNRTSTGKITRVD